MSGDWSIKLIWGSDFSNTDMIMNALLIAIPALLCITIHELAHGFVAYKLGDNTAKMMGRLTFNPIKHIDIIGLLMILIIGFGWAKPVPVDMRNFKNPKFGMAITSFAGPLSNIILALIVLFVYRLLPFPVHSLGMTIVSRTVVLSTALAVFNMLPIPPLDGSKILFSVLSDRLYLKLMRYERYGMIVLMLLMISGRFLNFDIFGRIVFQPAVVIANNMDIFVRSVIGFFS